MMHGARRLTTLAATLAAFLLMCSAPIAASADIDVTRAQAILALAPDPPAMRRELARVADSLGAGDPAASGDAFYWLGICEHEAGLADRSIEHLRRAILLRNGPDERLALIDGLIARAGPGDLGAADSLLRDIDSQAGSGEDRTLFLARLGWLRFIQGRSDSAAKVFEPLLYPVRNDPVWGERAGLAFAAGRSGDAGNAFALLLPVIVDSRGADRPAVDALRSAFAADPRRAGLDFDRLVRGAIGHAVFDEDRVIEALGGQRLRARASDGAPISAAWFGDGRKRPLLVTLMAPGDSIAGYDSLVVTMRRAGLSVLLVERRGTRGAASPSCRLPYDTFGREQALEERIARDAAEALRAAARRARLDTSRVLFAGVRRAAPTAVLAAREYGRTTAVVLVSPDPPPPSLGPTRARIAALGRPLFIQLSGEDYDLTLIPDALYQSSPRGVSFISESHAPGRGAAQFRSDRHLGQRFERWLADALKLPPPRLAPRSPRRRG
ncbi:MAG TPA: hypothetical protein VL123_03090 [Candidatus Udaeobacter sp.]|jgi:dienelactone hydrolase|nr:hypothetical protein [Candidatus Udaeobacter sp.]